ncbi:unnamed protein product [Vitrella brassicaformis CCMP3155]|uniref:Uncharacterized protein n=2 Tax=Vitrella brassicaformis TaxID=1169539 RepID=A0A0G4H5S1_VITBC|nr:unnamed protein product [Vitrella brassicaformis CCMP3155]|eukprot:CEM39187.1 unnamed protein product [Vitrella brassicaformis CCMP3155]
MDSVLRQREPSCPCPRQNHRNPCWQHNTPSLFKQVEDCLRIELLDALDPQSCANLAAASHYFPTHFVTLPYLSYQINKHYGPSSSSVIRFDLKERANIVYVARKLAGRPGLWDPWVSFLCSARIIDEMETKNTTATAPASGGQPVFVKTVTDSDMAKMRQQMQRWNKAAKKRGGDARQYGLDCPTVIAQFFLICGFIKPSLRTWLMKDCYRCINRGGTCVNGEPRLASQCSHYWCANCGMIPRYDIHRRFVKRCGFALDFCHNTRELPSELQKWLDSTAFQTTHLEEGNVSYELSNLQRQANARVAAAAAWPRNEAKRQSRKRKADGEESQGAGEGEGEGGDRPDEPAVWITGSLVKDNGMFTSLDVYVLETTDVDKWKAEPQQKVDEPELPLNEVPDIPPSSHPYLSSFRTREAREVIAFMTGVKGRVSAISDAALWYNRDTDISGSGTTITIDDQ